MSRFILISAMLLAMMGCEDEGPRHSVEPNKPVNQVADREVKIEAIPLPRLEMSPIDEVQELNQKSSAPAPAITRITTKSPEEFLAALQRIEESEPVDRVTQLRGALTLLQAEAAKEIFQIASASPMVKPQFTDQQLMEIAFGQINGMNSLQVIEHVRKIDQKNNK